MGTRRHVCTDLRSSPSYELLDLSIVPKDDFARCEDAVVLTDSHVAVIDGMTTGFGDRRSGRAVPPGRIAAKLMVEVTASLAPRATAREAVTAYTDALRDDGRRFSAVLFGASIVCLSLNRREAWRVGDCHLRIGRQEHFGEKGVDNANSAYRAAINHASLASGASAEQLRAGDVGRQATGPLLDAQRHLANYIGPFGFGVVNGTPVPAEFIEVHPLPDNGVEVTMMSDGYPAFGTDLADAEARLAEALSRDPVCINELSRMAKAWEPGTNGPDDRSYVRLRLTDVAS